MSNASFVPYYYVRKVLNLCLAKHTQNGQTNFLIDGFPRSKEKAQFFDGEGSRFPTKAFSEGRLTAIAGLGGKDTSSLSLL